MPGLRVLGLVVATMTADDPVAALLAELQENPLPGARYAYSVVKRRLDGYTLVRREEREALEGLWDAANRYRQDVAKANEYLTTTRPDHPLLTKVLADSMRTTDHLGSEPSECGCLDGAKEYVAAIPPDIADRLEAALERCAFEESGDWCDRHRNDPCHTHDPKLHPEADLYCHPYKPLVEVP